MLYSDLIISAVTLVSLWGLFFGDVQVGWTDWLTRTVPDAAESAGDVQIAIIQLYITIGTSEGGLAFDIIGANGVFIFSSLCALTASSIAIFAFRKKTTIEQKLYVHKLLQCYGILIQRFDK